MRISCIDIGTNTVLLLVADIDENGIIHPVEELQRIPRLGKDVDGRNMIHVASFDRVAWIVNEYKNLSNQLGAAKILAAATSAVRDASNRDEFIEYIRSATGLTVEVLPGDEEALWTYRGAVSGVPKTSRPLVVLDIGGGSTEVSFPYSTSHNGGERLQRYSFQIGSVRLTERYFKHHPPTAAEIESAVQLIREEFSQVRNPGFEQYRLVAVAGTATTLACLAQQLREFDVSRVSGYTIEYNVVEEWTVKLARMSPQQVLSLSGATEGRSDILAAGVLILNESMKHFGFRTVIVSERGLRFGLVLREWERTVQK
ncbi:MAG TPA: Ppx/GppA family phosphatase [Bacteroidota bacterium]|jgi:exopolyphosphatase/guanosine-5'-triphosphate,3'-diphosphate pyrophosphatase|nr:Ppx/GppA family phosphatase [Bacteroidota bacterium]